MKITKEMGREALRAMEVCAVNQYGFFESAEACDAIEELGWLTGKDKGCFFSQVTPDGDLDRDEVLTALAMCAAIAGVKP